MPVMDDSFQAFVTNLGKYNEGELVGEWVKFPTTEEEMQKVFERIGIGSKDEFGHVYEECSCSFSATKYFPYCFGCFIHELNKPLHRVFALKDHVSHIKPSYATPKSSLKSLMAC